eukprot:1248156-Pyramimonas_sp.AAC.1
MSRVTDPMQLASISFERDKIVTEMNEYETLMLMMGECRERLAAYEGNIEVRPPPTDTHEYKHNEYETLMLIMGECRERLAAYE